MIRWNDPGTPNTAVEDIFSSTDANSLELPSLPSDGNPIYAVGSILPPGATTLIGADGTGEATVVYDTDRWVLDLSDRAAGQPVSVAVQLDRHYGDTGGDMGLYDPWLAVVPRSIIPTPTVDGTSSGACPDGPTFGYPASLLAYLHSQVFLSAYAYVDADSEAPTNPSDACDGGTTPKVPAVARVTSASRRRGIPAALPKTVVLPRPHAQGWDRDGVLNEDEPEPESFVQQVQVMQCTLAAGDSTRWRRAADSSGRRSSTRMRLMKTTPYTDRNAIWVDGPAKMTKAYLELDLIGGQEYVIVVGGQTDQGVYEFSVTDISD